MTIEEARRVIEGLETNMTLIPEHIIQEALKGGFAYYPKNLDEYDLHRVFVCSPHFWQTLGKARGWNDGLVNETHEHAHQLLSLLLSSPSQEQVDKFWNELP